jgi:UDP-N-acetylglucosamine transferase subunit ALG13
MGSILTAIELSKPIVVMPRRAHLGEHRNDHQWATVNRLGEDVGIAVAADETELVDFLGRLTELRSPTERRSNEYTRLLEFLRTAMDVSK